MKLATAVTDKSCSMLLKPSGSSYKRRMIGNFGGAEVFSFHATKFLNAFEGERLLRTRMIWRGRSG